MSTRNGFFRFLEALVDGAIAADGNRKQQSPQDPNFRGRPPAPRPTQPQQKPGCGGCSTGKR